MKLKEFFAKHPIFSIDELLSVFGQGRSKRTVESLLSYHLLEGKILRVRRGLYASIPAGFNSKKFSVDPFLIASMLTDDAVLSHHTALEFFGKAYSVYEKLYYLSSRPTVLTKFKTFIFQGSVFPRQLRQNHNEEFGVVVEDRAGMDIKVTTLERTMVDILDRPKLGGGWEEIWKSLEMVEFFDLNKVIEYALLLKNKSTIAKVGFYLEHHKDELMVNDSHLNELNKNKPLAVHYMDRNLKSKIIKEWNLAVPLEIIERHWSETV